VCRIDVPAAGGIQVCVGFDLLSLANPPPGQHQALGDLAASTGANRQISMFVRYDDCIRADSRHRGRN
jgi:hypothetical protein